MKRIVFLIFLIALSKSIFAQTIRFTDTTNTWKVFFYSCGGDPYFVSDCSVKYAGDTIVHGIGYKKLNDCFFPFNPLVREDTLTGKVYIIYAISDSDTAEKTLYDYSLHIGDTLIDNMANSRVLNIDTVLVNGIPHRVWHFMPTSTSVGIGELYVPYNVIEGIGCTYDPIFPIAPMQFEDCYAMTCFTNNGTTPTLDRTIDHFDNSTSCALTFGLSVPNTIANEEFMISPNPVATDLMISSTDMVKDALVYNIVGQQVTHLIGASHTMHIDVKDLASGVYFVKINNITTKQFIKN
jgi:Secretion system C-terminal sorting domain